MNKQLFWLITILQLSTLISQAEDNARMQAEFPLDSSRVYDIPVTYEDGTTTIIFPGTITSLRAGKIGLSSDPNPRASFDVEFTADRQGEGFSYFSLRARSPQSHDVLTVLFEGKAYCLHLTASDGPLYAVRFVRELAHSVPGQKSKAIEPARLMSILDQVKAAPILKPSHPEVYYDVTSYLFRDSDKKPCPLIMHYDGFDCRVIETYRFDSDDTLVFRLELENFTNDPIEYVPGDIGVRLSDKIYPVSIADASGVMMPHTTSLAYIAITGSPDGTRNNKEPDNLWNILIPRLVIKSAQRVDKNSTSADTKEIKR